MSKTDLTVRLAPVYTRFKQRALRKLLPGLLLLLSFGTPALAVRMCCLANDSDFPAPRSSNTSEDFNGIAGHG